MSLLDIENEIQFHFQLEIVPSRQVGSQQIENEERQSGLIPDEDYDPGVSGGAPVSVAPKAVVVHFLGSSGLLAFSAYPRWAQSLCCSAVIWVGVSPAGTELHRIVSSNPGAEKMKVRLIGSAPTFFRLTHVLAGMNASPPAWISRSLSPSQTWAVPLWISNISSWVKCLCLGMAAPGAISSMPATRCSEPLFFGLIFNMNWEEAGALLSV
jgi:hypothetical protein